MSHDIITLLLLASSAAICVVGNTTQETRESRIVQTTNGRVKGYKTDGVFQFYGIPYASAPTGTRRFTAPLPAPVWITTLEAVTENIMCPQGTLPGQDYTNLNMREDCLVANVFMPNTEETNLPVVVHVHGGAYQIGFGNAASPSALVRTKKIVAVTFNYRLGAHGFLCLGTENAPGNAGMKDMVELLRWVQKNIGNFGGNPNEVTIAGCSAGSSAVDLLILSNMTTGLYNKAIAGSGANVAGWSVQLDPVQNAKEYAQHLNFTDINNIKNLEQFFLNLPFEVLMSDIFAQRKDSSFQFSPCIERDTGSEKFLEDAPFNILKEGKYRKVPVLYGFASLEDLFRAAMFNEWKESMNERFSDFLPPDLQFANNEDRELVAQKIKEFYFDKNSVSEDTVQGYIDYFSDVLFAYPHLRSVKLQVERGSDSIYLYEYSYFKNYSENAAIPEQMRNIKGAAHCAQNAALLENFKFTTPYCPDSEDFKKHKEMMIKLWVNFITTGNPTPEGSEFPSWTPVGANRSPHMNIGEEIKLKGSLLKERALFWDEIYEKYYRLPVAPSTHNGIGKV